MADKGIFVAMDDMISVELVSLQGERQKFQDATWQWLWITLWWTNKKLLNMAIEIVDFPIKNGDFPIKNGDFPWQNVNVHQGKLNPWDPWKIIRLISFEEIF